MDGASCVPNLVRQTAGANKGLRVSDGSCTPQTPAPTPTPTPTDPPPTPTPPPGDGTNLSIGAGADGSSKASGTSYGNVIDGNLNSYWSPNGSTGDISVKWSSEKTVSKIVIREASGSSIGSWQVRDHDAGTVLASGSGAGTITFSPTTLRKITFRITSSSGTPRVAEFETYAG